jgi:hypothetical protein
LRYPFWGLKAIRDVMRANGRLLIFTGIYEGEPNNAMLHCPTHDGPFSPDDTSVAFFNEKGIRDTLESLGFTQVAVHRMGQPEPYAPPEPLTPLTLKDLLRHPRNTIRVAQSRLNDYEHLRQEPPKDPDPIKWANWAVIDAVYSGFDKENVISRYWEGFHDVHTVHG